jgi:hypothetical protein
MYLLYLIGSTLFFIGSLIFTFDHYYYSEKIIFHIFIAYILFDLGCFFFILDSLKVFSL